MQKHRIVEVVKNSIADELGISSGSFLTTINGKEIIDVLDFELLCANEHLELCWQDDKGEYIGEVEKDAYEGLGLVFESQLMDECRRCKNRCIFCFIDQMPKDMRDTLYIKDDDWRLSLMCGNYITLTNVSEAEFERIIKLKPSVLYISVHTTDAELRGWMMGHKKPKPILERLHRLKENDIRFHSQIVSCPGINDGDNLIKTVKDLFKLTPNAVSVAVVPVGVSKDREGLYNMSTYTQEQARALIESIEPLQRQYEKSIGNAFVYLADEFYVKAKMDTPPPQHYGEFELLEDGIGLLASTKQEFKSACLDKDKKRVGKLITIVTGVSAAPFIRELIESEGFCADVIAIENEFFGKEITVAGLVTGQDIIKQLKQRDIKGRLIVPDCMLKRGENVFLDDYTLDDIQRELGIEVEKVAADGQGLYDALTKTI